MIERKAFEPILNIINNIIINLIKKNYIVVHKYKEGIIKNGTFIPCNFKFFSLVDKSKNLILEKGKYKILPREENQFGPKDPVGMSVINNTYESYNKFWGDENIIKNYLCDNRIKFFNDVFNICKQYLKGRIIEVGCGSGEFLRIIKENTNECKIHGFDFSESAVERCKKIIPEGEFQKGDIYSMQYQDNLFDVVLCLEVLEHLEKPKIALNELKRICKKGGKIIITIPNGVFDDYVGHLNFWTEQEFKSFLGESGLKDFYYLEDELSMLFIIQN